MEESDRAAGSNDGKERRGRREGGKERKEERHGRIRQRGKE